MGCSDGYCGNERKYFTPVDEDVTIVESFAYMTLTPILYFGILFLLEFQVIQRLIAKLWKSEVSLDTVDEQVMKEKLSIAQRIPTTGKRMFPKPINQDYA